MNYWQTINVSVMHSSDRFHSLWHLCKNRHHLHIDCSHSVCISNWVVDEFSLKTSTIGKKREYTAMSKTVKRSIVQSSKIVQLRKDMLCAFVFSRLFNISASIGVSSFFSSDGPILSAALNLLNHASFSAYIIQKPRTKLSYCSLIKPKPEDIKPRSEERRVG